MFNILSNKLRYIVASIVDNYGKNDLEAVVDTGAMFTTFIAYQISPLLKESDFKNIRKQYIGGFIKNINKTNKNDYVVVFYEYKIKELWIGNINLGTQIVWITFDNRISDNLLGMDILKQLSFLQYGNSNMLSLFANKNELNAYVGGVIERKKNKTSNPNTFYVEYDSMRCFFNKSKIRKTKLNQEYIMIGNTVCRLL